MKTNSSSEFFTKEVSKNYDEANNGLKPITNNMHFLIQLILNDLPQDAHILCIGVGTGEEILSLSKMYPQWKFVGIDPSNSMLEVCHNRLEEADLLGRCELINGYVNDLPGEEHFDAVLSILVGHFVPRDERFSFYQSMYQKLKKGGYLVNTEISFNLESIEYPSMIENWGRIQKIMGASSESLKSLPQRLKETLCVLPPHEVEQLIQNTGISIPIKFFQALMITGWYGQKE